MLFFLLPIAGQTLRPDLHLAYTHRRKVKNNWTQYSSPEIFWQCNQDTEL